MSKKTDTVGARAIFQTYLEHVRKYRLQASLALLGAILAQATNLAVPLYLRELFNTLSGSAPSQSQIPLLLHILVFLGVAWVANWAAVRLQDFSNLYLQAKVMTSLYEGSFSYLLGHSYDFFISRFAGALTHKVGRFARAFEIMCDTIITQFFPTVLFVLGAIVILFIHNRVLGLVLAGWTVLFSLFGLYITRVRQSARESLSKADSEVTGSLADAIGNQSVITLFSGIQFEQGLFTGIVEVWRRAVMRSWFIDASIGGAMGLFMIAIEVALLWGAIVYWSKGMFTVGDFVLIQSYLFTTFSQLSSMFFQLRRFYQAFADAGEMVEILEEPHGVEDAPGAKPLSVRKGEIVFDDVTFSFGNSRNVLTEFNLHIPGRQKVALVGPSGAGKSTITRLLLRLYDVQKGNILIDGQNIKTVTQESVREAISFVPQEPILFHRSLKENIRYGKRDATDKEVIAAAKKAHCHEFISLLSQGYDTPVGERGVKLSGGERQRIAIARAILKNSPILVLDEATSSLDSESEALIQDALETLMKGKTVLVIAHRLSTIMKMDRIVVMQGGAVVAEGTHLELIHQHGLYQKLWSIQAGGFLTDEEENLSVKDAAEDEVETEDDDEVEVKGQLANLEEEK